MKARNIVEHVITDCGTGSKYRAIVAACGATCSVSIAMVDPTAESAYVPSRLEAFGPAVSKRLQQAAAAVSPARAKGSIFISIQKGYFRDNAGWQLSAIVGLYRNGTYAYAHAEPVPFGAELSQEKDRNRSESFKSIVARKFLRWDANNDSLYSLLVGGASEDEWLIPAVDACFTKAGL